MSDDNDRQSQKRQLHRAGVLFLLYVAQLRDVQQEKHTSWPTSLLRTALQVISTLAIHIVSTKKVPLIFFTITFTNMHRFL